MAEQRKAWGWGLASIDAAGNTLDVWYPKAQLGEAPAEADRLNHGFGALVHEVGPARRAPPAGVHRIQSG